MALYAISDLHLSSDGSKSMEVFGDKWYNYMNRIKENWISVISDNDTVVIPGDISWAMHLEDAVEDFKYLNDLPGKKIIGKGNHDYWWATLNKLNKFNLENKFDSISYLSNNSFLYKDVLICGNRGWTCPTLNDVSEEDIKIFDREVQRLRLSLESGKTQKYDRIIVATHYPPFEKDKSVNTDIENLFKEFNVTLCIYGHLHGPSHLEAFEGIINGIEYKFIASDYLGFTPKKLID